MDYVKCSACQCLKSMTVKRTVTSGVTKDATLSVCCRNAPLDAAGNWPEINTTIENGCFDGIAIVTASQGKR
jgi:hypothetical protein